MMVSEELKMVYIDPPKTGSMSCDNICKKNGFSYIKYRNPGIQRGKKYFNKHQRFVPKKYQDYTTIASIRNPYERLYSLYHFDKAHKYNFIGTSMKSFFTYVSGIVKKYRQPVKNNDIRKYRYFPLHMYLEVARVDKFVRTENLFGDLADAGLQVEQNKVRLNTGKYIRTWKDVKSPELIEMINEWAGADFELYGYEKL